MSGGIAQLVAVGAQDVHLVGQPEVSFFRSTYKRHTNFSQTVERQVIQGNVSNNGMSTIRFERKGDMLNYVYLMPIKSDGTQSNVVPDWTTAISKVELLIGGQVIDEQDSTYSTLIAPTLSATSSAKSVSGDLYGGSTNERFYPLRFAFCENWQTALPLISLQYHDVELRITWGAAADTYKWEIYANYAYLDTQEREMFASKPQNMLITQVQKAISSGSKTQEAQLQPPHQVHRCLQRDRREYVPRHEQDQAPDQRYRCFGLQVREPQLHHGSSLLSHLPRQLRPRCEVVHVPFLPRDW